MGAGLEFNSNTTLNYMKIHNFNNQVRSHTEILINAIGKGKAAGITNDELREKIYAETGEKLTQAALREAIHEIRTSRPAIKLGVLAGDNDGYYWAATKEEALKWIVSHRGRVKSQWDVLKAQSANFVLLWQQGRVGEITAEAIEMLGFEPVPNVERAYAHPLGFYLKRSYGEYSHIWGLVDAPEAQKAVQKFETIWEVLEWWDNKDVPF